MSKQLTIKSYERKYPPAGLGRAIDILRDLSRHWEDFSTAQRKGSLEGVVTYLQRMLTEEIPNAGTGIARSDE